MGSTVGRPTPKKKPGKKSKEQTKKTKKVEPRKAKSMFARLHVTSKTSNKKKKKKSKKKPKKKNKSMQLKPADSPAPVEDDTETNTTESVASTGATRTVIEMKPPSRSSGKRDQVAEPDTVAQKPKKREKKSASLPNVGRTARTQPDGSAYEPSVPKEVTDKERDSVSLRGLRSQCADNALLTELANKRAHGDNFFQMANPFAKDDDLDVSDTIFDVANEFPDLILVGGMPTTPRAAERHK